jgi:hypothetical protein
VVLVHLSQEHKTTNWAVGFLERWAVSNASSP